MSLGGAGGGGGGGLGGKGLGGKGLGRRGDSLGAVTLTNPVGGTHLWDFVFEL